MSLGKEYSIIADSTISSSPQLIPDASALVKRHLRTYGRRREEPPAEDAGNSATFLGSIHGSADSVHCTAPPGLSEEVPPSSPRTNHAGRGDTNDDEAPQFTKFDYAWRTKLKRLDEEEDDLPEENDSSTTSLFGQANLLHVPAGKSTDLNSRTEPCILKPPPSISDDVFSGLDLDKNASPPQIFSAKPSFVLSPPAIGPTRNSRMIQDSDSEPEALKDSSSTTPSSSSQLQHLISPKLRSLSTPPTSEDDMQANILTKPRSTGRGKPLATSRGSVPPLEFSEGPSREVRRPSGTKQKSRKPKAPTKKDITEITKERVRLAAQTNASIPRNEMSSKYTVESFFAKIHGGNAKQLESVLNIPPTSDPIEPFSSPLHNSRSATTQPPSYIPELPEDSDSDDFEPPPVSELLEDVMEKSRRKELQDMKQKLIHSKKAPVDVSDDDDDLKIIPRSPNKIALVEQRKNLKERRISEGRKRQMQLAKVRTAKVAVPIVGLSQNGIASIISKQATTRVDQVVLNRIMAAEVRKEAQQATKQKEEAWQKHGGHLRTRPEVQPEGLSVAVDSLAKKVLKAAELHAANEMDVEGDDEDEDWSPDFKGSDSFEQEAGDENTPMVEDTIMATGELLDEDEVGKVRTSTSRRMIVQSDSDSDEIDENVPVKLQALQRYRRSTSSSEQYTEDEQDKENDTALMYDGTEDKENQALVLRQLSSNSIFDITEVGGPSLSPTFPSREWNARNGDVQLGVGDIREQRSPLKELISEESPSSLRPSTLAQSFAVKLQQASPLHGTSTPTPTLKSFLGGGEGSNGFDGFSQFSQREPDVFGAAPLLQPGFSDLFENASEGRNSFIKADGGGRPTDSAKVNINEQRIPQRTDTLELTQDVTSVLNLQPAFQVQESLMRKADAIFEKEQAFVLEAAKKRPDKASSALYVNEHGFLTQTRPEKGSPEIYRPSPSQSLHNGDSFPALLISPLQPRPRAPLRTLSMSSYFPQPDSPERVPLRRLRKAATPPPFGLRFISPPATTPPRKRDAFEMLARGATKAEKRRHDKLKGVDPSAFLENEAAESDDEDALGFAKLKDEDEEDGEDLDKTLDVLMDDNEMDEATVAAELVHEKFMEQAEEEDQKLEKIHMAVVQGEHRKRQRGVGVDDSDEESEDGNNSKARRAMKKLKMIERGDIKDLGANEATRAFADTYKQTLQDDDQEFSYLINQSESNDVLSGNILPEREEEQDENDDQEEETISSEEVARQIRQRAVEGVTMDPGDVSWTDKYQREESPRLKTVDSRKQFRSCLQDSDLSEIDGTLGATFRKSGEQISVSSKRWFAQENRSRNAGTSRSVGGSAITGHAKTKSTRISSPKGSLASITQETTSSTNGNRGIKPAPSILSVITDKSRHFM